MVPANLIRVELDRLVLRVGDCILLSFIIADRKRSNGTKYPKNYACEVRTHALRKAQYYDFSDKMSLPEVIAHLVRLGFNPSPFIEAALELGWTDVLGNPNQKSLF